MQRRTLLLALCLLAVVNLGRQHGQLLATWLPDPEVEAALDVRCGDLGIATEREECESALQERFIGGEVDPVAILRQHCTRWPGGWPGARHEAEPPTLCVDRFGGWISG